MTNLFNDIFFNLPGEHGSHCGISDLYPDREKILRTAIDEGKPFFASWSAKKSIWNATIERTDEHYRIHVESSIDELDGLVDTLLWEVSEQGGDSGWAAVQNKLGTADEEEVDKYIQDVIEQIEEDYCEYHSATGYSPLNATYDEVMEKVSNLMDEAVGYEDECVSVLTEKVRAIWKSS